MIVEQTKSRGPESILPEAYTTPVLPTNDFTRAGTNPNAFNSRDFRYTRAEVIDLQTKMKALGYDLGDFGPNKDGIDGDPGRKFHQGLMRFAAEHGDLRFATKKDLGATMSAVVRGNAPEDKPEVRSPEPKARAVMSTAAIDERALSQARELLIKREGYRRTAYVDSEGHLTIGIGHKVTPADNIRPGQTISADRVERLFRQDFAKAHSAAKLQARQANCYTPEMICALTSVNFQLGTGWNKEFKRTWAALKKGDLRGAINGIYSSLWATQTPNRVNDFANAIRGHARSLADRGRDFIDGAADVGRNLWEGGKNLLEQSPLGRMFSSNAERGYTAPTAAPGIQVAAHVVTAPNTKLGALY